MRRWGLITAVMALAAIGRLLPGALVVFTTSIAAELDRASALSSIAPRPQATIVFDRHGKPAFSYLRRAAHRRCRSIASRRTWSTPSSRSRTGASISTSASILCASSAPPSRNLRAGRIVEGGSTITQQLARAAQLSPVRTYERKIREILVARAARGTLLEAADSRGISQHRVLRRGLLRRRGGVARLLRQVGRGSQPRRMPPCSPRWSARRRPTRPASSRVRATKRRNLVLALMQRQGRLSAEERAAAAATAVPGRFAQESAGASAVAAPAGTGLYFQEEVRRQLFHRFGADRVLRGGLRVVFRPTIPIFSARPSAPSRRGSTQIAGVAQGSQGAAGQPRRDEPQTGDVYALVGGRDFRESSFNRATQARRQAGSAFKPIIYAAALERGFAPGTLLKRSRHADRRCRARGCRAASTSAPNTRCGAR